MVGNQPVHRIAVIPGDGIGREIVPPAQEVVERACGHFGFRVQWTEKPWSCAYYAQTGRMMPADGVGQLAEQDAILLGAVGDPAVPDHISLWGLLIPIRRAFDQYVNLRPARLLPGVDSPLRQVHGGVDLLVVRENCEGEYSEVGGRLFRGTANETVLQEAVFTRRGVRRVTEYAVRLARGRSGRLVSATKSNGLVHSMPFWDEVVAEVASENIDVTVTSMHVDALAAGMVRRPDTLDVVVASNLFGDILTDVAAAVVGSLGIAPSANLNPEREHPSMFEPVHGSAPDIAGTGTANPVAQIWSAAMMLDHLGHPEAGAAVVAAIADVFAKSDVRTPDMGGTANTREVTAAVLAALDGHAPAVASRDRPLFEGAL